MSDKKYYGYTGRQIPEKRLDEHIESSRNNSNVALHNKQGKLKASQGKILNQLLALKTGKI